MNNIDIQLNINTLYPHIQQVYAGFSELHKEKYIKLTVTKKHNFAFNNPMPYVEGTINGFKVIFETHDGWPIPDEIPTSDVDFYFKRSYHSENLKNHPLFPKIYPLGLNYYVTTPNNFGTKNPAIDYLGMNKNYRSIINRIRGKHQSFQSDFEKLPNANKTPQILFLARAWDPSGTSKESNKEERFRINEMRALCIRSLRAHYGPSFIGGFASDSYSLANYKDCIVTDTSVTKKSNYLRTMQNADICVATTGLHGSIGWKFAEYVAASRAIVSEKLLYEVPGTFADGVNYLSFETTDQCLTQIETLVKNRELMLSMMQNNRTYYLNYVSPKAMVLNAINTVLKKTKD